MENNTKIHSYKDLIVWQKAMELVIAVYSLTEQYPKEEMYCLTSHIKKTSISIPSNIAEGRRRVSQKEFLRFLIIAYSSGAELETQIEIAKRLPWSKNLNFSTVDNLLLQAMKMLNKMTNNLK